MMAIAIGSHIGPPPSHMGEHVKSPCGYLGRGAGKQNQQGSQPDANETRNVERKWVVIG